MEIGGHFRPVDLLDRQVPRTVNVAVRPVAENQREFFGHVPRHVGGRARDGLGCAQSFAVIGVGVFDFGGFAFFGISTGTDRRPSVVTTTVALIHRELGRQ